MADQSQKSDIPASAESVKPAQTQSNKKPFNKTFKFAPKKGLPEKFPGPQHLHRNVGFSPLRNDPIIQESIFAQQMTSTLIQTKSKVTPNFATCISISDEIYNGMKLKDISITKIISIETMRILALKSKYSQSFGVKDVGLYKIAESNEFYIPDLLQKYLQGIGTSTELGGKYYEVQLPSLPEEVVEGFGGYHGYLDEFTHNLYEEVPCLGVMAEAMRQSMNEDQNYDGSYRPSTFAGNVLTQLFPNENYLGYSLRSQPKIDVINQLRSFGITPDYFPEDIRNTAFNLRIVKFVSEALSKIHSVTVKQTSVPSLPEKGSPALLIKTQMVTTLETSTPAVERECVAISSENFPKHIIGTAIAFGYQLYKEPAQNDPKTGNEILIEILSRPLRGAELHYTTTEKECLAVVWSVEKLRCYLEGMPFKVVTDHQALQWLHELKNPVGRLARWAIYLYQHDMTVEHRRGTLNEAPDALSRMFNVDVDPLGWEKVIEEAVQGRIRLNTICDQDWYVTKFDLVKKHPDRFANWKIENDELFYYRPDYEKALIDDENPWKKVVKPDDIPGVLRDNHDLPTQL